MNKFIVEVYGDDDRMCDTYRAYAIGTEEEVEDKIIEDDYWDDVREWHIQNFSYCFDDDEDDDREIWEEMIAPHCEKIEEDDDYFNSLPIIYDERN
jgi:hypothetical protein